MDHALHGSDVVPSYPLSLCIRTFPSLGLLLLPNKVSSVFMASNLSLLQEVSKLCDVQDITGSAWPPYRFFLRGGGGDVTVLMSCIKGFLEASGWSLYDAGLDRVFRYPRNGTSIDRGSISPRLLYVI